MSTIKVNPNDRCPCGSQKKYKKCCRSIVQKQLKKKAPDKFLNQARLSGVIYHNFLESCQKSIVWPILAENMVATHKIQAYSPVAIHPVHFIHSKNLNRSYAVTPVAQPLNVDESQKVPIIENNDYISLHEDEISISAHPSLTDQRGHLIPENLNGNVIRHHFGFYSVVYISTRDIEQGEPIIFEKVVQKIVQKVVQNFGQLHPDFMQAHSKFTEVTKRLQLLFDASKNFTEEDKTKLREKVEKLSH